MDEVAASRAAGPQPEESPRDEQSQALATLALAGDAPAFEQLVAKFQGPAWALARRITGDREVAMEMVQEAFLRVHVHRADYRPGQRFAPWFYRILVNLCLNATRNRKLRASPLSPAGFDGVQGPAHSGPEHQAEAHERDRALAEAFDRLPARYRAALALRLHAGLSVDQAAAAMDCPAGTVKTLVFRAREALRLRLEAWEGPGPTKGGHR